ncbi:hypothetical protein ONE63_002765 [Megalurothrips usitatus]|uniref:Uncharacterized protein n=1 Tax=Megalurothrips usitatus TaxID=439358 RepID=A0AAV7X894_9NEOP|nr:hypothetical protein ONE63_002765 [Megalurothrips usitatus]
MAPPPLLLPLLLLLSLCMSSERMPGVAAFPENRIIGNPQGSLACVSIASKCTGRDPYVECGGNRVCKSLGGCGWRCQGGLLDLTVAV